MQRSDPDSAKYCGMVGAALTGTGRKITSHEDFLEKRSSKLKAAEESNMTRHPEVYAVDVSLSVFMLSFHAPK